MKISAVIIAYNEEANIADAIGSVSFADEIVVVDSNSSDRTTEIAEKDAGTAARSTSLSNFKAMRKSEN